MAQGWERPTQFFRVLPSGGRSPGPCPPLPCPPGPALTGLTSWNWPFSVLSPQRCPNSPICWSVFSTPFSFSLRNPTPPSDLATEFLSQKSCLNGPLLDSEPGRAPPQGLSCTWCDSAQQCRHLWGLVLVCLPVLRSCCTWSSSRAGAVLTLVGISRI